MKYMAGRSALLLTALIIVSVANALGADDDGSANSPTPILLSEAASTRTLAVPEGVKAGSFERTRAQAFPVSSRVVVFATNLAFMDGEGANSLRATLQDAQGRMFRLPIVDVRLAQGRGGPTAIYAITLELRDVLRFWDLNTVSGDTLLGLTWRGNLSNRTRLAVNSLGGDIKDDPGAVPTPAGDGATKARRAVAARADAFEKFAGDRRRLLEQATFGPTDAAENRLKELGTRSWLLEQFNLPYPSATNPYPTDPLKTNNVGSDPLCDNNNTTTPADVPVTCFRDSYSMYRPQTWFMREAYYGDAQLRHRVAWALAQVWVTSGVDVQQGRHMVEYHKILSRNAFGNYKDLMKEMTLHPTMGDYLSMALSTRTNPNENYAREIMQLFSIGLFMLNQDGTLQYDDNLEPIPTYSQEGVNNLTEVLTGWSFCNVAASCPNFVSTTVPNYIDPMAVNIGLTVASNNRHDLSSKTLLDYPGSSATMNIAACSSAAPPNGCGLTCGATGNCTLTAGVTNTQAFAAVQSYATSSLDKAIDNLFNHPNVGPFVSKLMIQHMVTSDPTPAYVGRVAAVFNNNGLGVRGDMRAVVRAILLDPEARGSVKTDPSYGKLREPVQLTTNFARAFGVRSADGTTQSDGYIANANGGGAGGLAQFNGMAQLPFLSPTVFNFFPPDYVVPGTSYPGPEFAILNTGTAIARANFFNQMVYPATTPVPVSNPNAPNGTSFNFTDLVALVQADPSGNTLLDELNRRMMHGTMSPLMKTTILNSFARITIDANVNLNKVRQAVYLVATSSQYQVQR